ncbi:metal-sensitive transcriptional regulator [Microvenator marinus]|uniref:Metal-sensitive transcriptional regulator n=1 Tax=Microvenator marinus TaxID=2600177 RepID=A0A5B8XNH0_9DELT|nr:metal-sensitive transcriptional regulator [Microvenator marinus]QED26761.1 metal-sensitive transcriptional regulator [Microvenator marinus]
MMSPDTKEKIEARLKRVAGQVSGIQKMVEDDRYCIDVLMQISAARAALAKVSKMLLESHIQTCVTGAFESDDEDDRTAKIAELVRVFEKNCNC